MKLLVVDDHTLIREGLRNVLQDLGPGVTIVEAQDLRETLEALDSHADLSLVLLDLNLPDSSGQRTLLRVCEARPELPVIVLSAAEEPDFMGHCLEAGAMGFVAKSSVNSVLVDAIRLVLSGGMAIPPQVNRESLVLGRKPDLSCTPDTGEQTPTATVDLGLTERQLEVLALVMQGKSNKAICRDLDLAESTVKLHVSAILRALRVGSRTQAVLEATRLGVFAQLPE